MWPEVVIFFEDFPVQCENLINKLSVMFSLYSFPIIIYVL